MRPRSASTTKPVACEDEFHSVSKARVWSISMATTLSATRASVPRHAALSPSLCGNCAWVVADCAPTWRCTDCGCAVCEYTGEKVAGAKMPRPRIRVRLNFMRNPYKGVSSSSPENQDPDNRQQQQ